MDPNLLLWSAALIGSAGIATGVVGVLLPAGQRIEVLLALVAGAGSGLVVLAAELLSATGSPQAPERLFFYAACAGWLTVMGVLLALWLGSRRLRGLRARGTRSYRHHHEVATFGRGSRPRASGRDGRPAAARQRRPRRSVQLPIRAIRPLALSQMIHQGRQASRASRSCCSVECREVAIPGDSKRVAASPWRPCVYALRSPRVTLPRRSGSGPPRADEAGRGRLRVPTRAPTTSSSLATTRRGPSGSMALRRKAKALRKKLHQLVRLARSRSAVRRLPSAAPRR